MNLNTPLEPPPIANLFRNLPTPQRDEFMETIAHGKNIRIERIVSHGHLSPSDFWYDQSEHEWVCVLQGNATIEFEFAKTQLAPGDWIEIPAGVRHRVASTSNTEPTIWLAVFFQG